MGEVKKGVGILSGKKSSKNQDKKTGRLFTKIFMLFGLVHAVVVMVFFYVIFIVAYLDDYTILIDFNAIGEAHIELVVFTIAMLISVITMVEILDKL